MAESNFNNGVFYYLLHFAAFPTIIGNYKPNNIINMHMDSFGPLLPLHLKV